METNWRREQSAEAETYQDALSESEKKVGLLASKLSIAAANRMADDEMNSNNEKIVMTKRKKNLHRLEWKKSLFLVSAVAAFYYFNLIYYFFNLFLFLNFVKFRIKYNKFI